MAKRSKNDTARRKLRNKPGPPPVNAFPECKPLDLERLGSAGVRIGLERVLQHLHDFGDGIWRELGVSKRKLKEYKGQVVDVLRQISLDREASRSLNRSGAMIIYGELGGEGALPDLKWVLQDEQENAVTRGWAARAIGAVGGDAAAKCLIPQLDARSPIVRRQAIGALSESSSKLALEALRDVVRKTKDSVDASNAHQGVQKLEKALRAKPASLEFDDTKARRKKRKTSAPVD